MQVDTMRDVAVLVRSTRLARGMTQAELAAQMGVSRDWVVRLEKGHPRLEVQRVLDALHVLGVEMQSTNPSEDSQGERTSQSPVKGGTARSHKDVSVDPLGSVGRAGDPFDDLFKTDGGR